MRSGEMNPGWRVGAGILAPVVGALFRLRVEGLERLPTEGPALVAFNHVSALDGPLIAIVIARRARRVTRFLVGAEFMRLPLIGGLLRWYSQIPLRRGQGDSGALNEAITAVQAGTLLGIAPEGSVNPNPGAGLGRVRTGAARIALHAGAPVVPLGIWGTQSRWPRSGLRLRGPWRPVVGIAFGDPIPPPGHPLDQHNVDLLTEGLRTGLERQALRARALAEGGA